MVKQKTAPCIIITEVLTYIVYSPHCAGMLAWYRSLVKLTCGTRFTAHLTVNALSCIRVLHLPWNTRDPPVRACLSVSQLTAYSQKQCFRFTRVTGRRLADPVLEFVVFPAFGTYVAICAEFTIGDAGQAGIVTPVRIESPGAMCSTATLVEETFLSIFIWEGGGGGGHRGLVTIQPAVFFPPFKMPLTMWNYCNAFIKRENQWASPNKERGRAWWLQGMKQRWKTLLSAVWKFRAQSNDTYCRDVDQHNY